MLGFSFSDSILGTGLEVVEGVVAFFFFSELKHTLRKKKISFPLALLTLLGDKASSGKSPNGL
jgi:hypothetical protein